MLWVDETDPDWIAVKGRTEKGIEFTILRFSAKYATPEIEVVAVEIGFDESGEAGKQVKLNAFQIADGRK